jgi:hypothetical protein
MSSGTTPPTQTQQGGGVPSSGAAQLAGDGKPLIPPGFAPSSPKLGSSAISGAPVLSPTQQGIATELGKDYSGKELENFQGITQSMSSLRYMDAAYDNMAQGGGFNVPGTLATFRGDFSKAVNTLAQATGQPPPFDPTKIASIEDFNKETKRMGAQITNSFFGGSRESASVINSMTASVPGIENTYLGGKLLIQGIQGTLQRGIDWRNFENQWQQQNQGNLTGALESFNQLHPAQDYANKVLNQFGMNEKGFQSPEAVKSAVTAGYLTRTEASGILKQQFPDQFH